MLITEQWGRSTKLCLALISALMSVIDVQVDALATTKEIASKYYWKLSLSGEITVNFVLFICICVFQP